ncbi:MAG: 50S ribosomal protein L4 [Candidatus Sericytochromatia bacterium]
MTVTLKKFDTKENKYSEDLSVNPEVFAQDPNVHVMHLAVVRQLANARLGTHSTLTKSEVRGGGKKPWKQKGTGRARAGSSRSPLWKGGGVIFGPKPRSYEKDMPKKVRKLALRSALSSEVNKMIVLSGDIVSSHKTSGFVKILESLGLEKVKKVLLVIGDNNNARLSARNLSNVKIVYPEHVGVYDLVNAEKILVSEEALAVLEGRAKNE